ncbi:hypothetical protein OC842_007525, partial [Tilletia horrida]
MSSAASFTRPRFALPLGTDAFPLQEEEEDNMLTLYDVLEQSAALNPDHLYAIQHVSLSSLTHTHSLTHAGLLRAVDRCSAWLLHSGLAARFSVSGKEKRQRRPPRIAILLHSDLATFIHVLAALKLGNPVALLSPRLSPHALAHLLTATDTQSIITTRTLARSLLLSSSSSTGLHIAHALPYTDFLSLSPTPHLDPLPIPPKGDESNETRNDSTVFVWHSSGSTGLPKPVFHTHRFWHCYLACHDFAPHHHVHAKRALNMPPLYH